MECRLINNAISGDTEESIFDAVKIFSMTEELIARSIKAYRRRFLRQRDYKNPSLIKSFVTYDCDKDQWFVHLRCRKKGNKSGEKLALYKLKNNRLTLFETKENAKIMKGENGIL